MNLRRVLAGGPGLIAAASAMLFLVAPAAHAGQVAFVQGLVYQEGQPASAARPWLGTLELGTTTIRPLAPLSLVGQTPLQATPLLAGLAYRESDRTLYGVSVNSTGQSVLYIVNTTNGQLTQLGTPYNLTTIGGTLSGISFGTDGVLYGLVSTDTGSTTNTSAYGNARLARFTFTNPPSTTVRPTPSFVGLSPIFKANGGMTADTAGNLYVSQGSWPQTANSLYRIRPTGPTSQTVTALSSEAGFGANVFALSFNKEDGRIYAFDDGGDPGFGEPAPSAIYTIDPATGAGTFVDAVSAPNGTWSITAASNAYTAPEPGSVALTLAGIAGAGILRRRRRK